MSHHIYYLLSLSSNKSSPAMRLARATLHRLPVQRLTNRTVRSQISTQTAPIENDCQFPTGSPARGNGSDGELHTLPLSLPLCRAATQSSIVYGKLCSTKLFMRKVATQRCLCLSFKRLSLCINQGLK